MFTWHTHFSHDSEATPEQMIEGAIQKGLEVICFTDHYDKDNMSWGPEDIFEPEPYFQTLVPLQEKYRGKIEVRIGVRAGTAAPPGRVLPRICGKISL